MLVLEFDYPKAQVALEQFVSIAQKNNKPARETYRLKNLGNVYTSGINSMLRRSTVLVVLWLIN